MNKQKPDWAKGERLWEGFADSDNPSKLNDAYFNLFGEAYVETVIDDWSDLDSYYALLPKGRVEGFKKINDGYKYFYSLNPIYKSKESSILDFYNQKENEINVEVDGMRFNNYKFEIIKINDKLMFKLTPNKNSTILISCMYCKSFDCKGC